MSPDSKDCIHTNTFYAYVRSKVILLQTRIQLACVAAVRWRWSLSVHAVGPLRFALRQCTSATSPQVARPDLHGVAEGDRPGELRVQPDPGAAAPTRPSGEFLPLLRVPRSAQVHVLRAEQERCAVGTPNPPPQCASLRRPIGMRLHQAPSPSRTSYLPRCWQSCWSSRATAGLRRTTAAIGSLVPRR